MCGPPTTGGFDVHSFLKLLKDEDGATAIEYGLIAALIAVAAVATMTTVGTNLTSTFSTVANKL
jgi:pilus assembly protein Flp/PilA